METRKLAQLTPNVLNPRGAVIEDDSLRELAASIKSVGLLQPLLITPAGVVIAGHRRLAAAKIAGLVELPVIVRDISEVEQVCLMLIENMQRKSLGIVQEGIAFGLLLQRGLSVRKLSEAIGVAVHTIDVRLAIARLPKEVHPFFDSGQLPIHCGECLEGLTPEKQIQLATRASREGWAGNRLCREARAIKEPRIPSEDPTPAESRELNITTAIKQLYAATDLLLDYKDLRAAVKKIGDGIFDLEQSIKKPRGPSEPIELRSRSSLLN